MLLYYEVIIIFIQYKKLSLILHNKRKLLASAHLPMI